MIRSVCEPIVNGSYKADVMAGYITMEDQMMVRRVLFSTLWSPRFVVAAYAVFQNAASVGLRSRLEHRSWLVTTMARPAWMRRH